MNNKRSYLDTLNAGRQRKPHTTLEQLNRSLETLEQRLNQPRDAAPERWLPPRSNPIHSYEPTPSYEKDPMAPRPRAAYDQRAGYEPRSTHEPRPAAEPRYDHRAAYEPQPYQSLARDMERVRGQEDGVAAFGKIAGELKGLREELRHQLTSGIRREFETLRKDIETASLTRSGKDSQELGLEFERLQGAIHNLAGKSDDRNVGLLRSELGQVKAALDTLAREETVLSVDRRFNDFEHRFSNDDRDRATDQAIAALADRLEQISDAVQGLPESLSLRSLEDKVRTLAGAVEHFAHQKTIASAETFGLIEDRLDEISRAIVASTVAAQTPYVDPEPFERIEARISALARQIEEVSDERPQVIDRLNALSQRVDQIAERAVMPEKSVERLARQIAVIADKIDHAPAMPDAGEIFAGIEQRFDMLSHVIERRQGDALDQGNLLLRELERRLDEVADRIDQRQTDAALDNNSIMGAIDARFSALAQRLEAGGAGDRSENAIRGLEARLEDISERIDQSASQYAGIDPDLIRNLESQVAGLTAHLSRPAAPLPDFEDLGPRLDEIERSIAGSRESILEAARQAAENAARSLATGQIDPSAVSGLTQDVKALENLTRRADERNGKTFEAIHDTLLKIVDRLGSLETDGAETPASARMPVAAAQHAQPAPRKLAVQDAPSIEPDRTSPFGGPPILETDIVAAPAPRASVERSPAQAAAAAALAAISTDGMQAQAEPARSKSMFGGIASAFRGKKQPKAEPAMPAAPSSAVIAPSVALDAPLDPKLANRPLEPGSGTPDLNAIMKRVRDERGQPIKHVEGDAAKSDFIAAARRAAQAAAAEAEVSKRNAELSGPVRALRIGDLLKARRKTVLMGTAAIMLALAGLQLGKAFMSDPAETATVDPMPIVPHEELDTASIGSTQPVAKPDATAPKRAELMAQAPADPVRTVGSGQDRLMAAPTTLPSPLDAVAPAKPIAATAQIVASAPVDTIVTEPMTAPAQAGAAPARQGAAIAFDIPPEAGPAPLREAAAAGDAKALFEVATRYADGRGVKADLPTAAKWYEKAADLGFAPAQYRIGNFYEKGLGVTRDVAKAKTWYQLAANQGNASAMHNLAVLFAMGADGVTDNESAARWFVEAAELGVKDSQFNLGILAAKGVGVPQDLEESYKWFALVAKTGDKDAAAKRDEVAKSLRPEQLERARATTELWKPKTLDVASNAVDVPDAWSDGAKDQTAGIDMKKAVLNIQLILGKAGYDVGKPDGVMGGKTRTAIASFQKDNDMPATGEIDEPLVRKLLALK